MPVDGRIQAAVAFAASAHGQGPLPLTLSLLCFPPVLADNLRHSGQVAAPHHDGARHVALHPHRRCMVLRPAVPAGLPAAWRAHAQVHGPQGSPRPPSCSVPRPADPAGGRLCAPVLAPHLAPTAAVCTPLLWLDVALLMLLGAGGLLPSHCCSGSNRVRPARAVWAGSPRARQGMARHGAAWHAAAPGVPPGGPLARSLNPATKPCCPQASCGAPTWAPPIPASMLKRWWWRLPTERWRTPGSGSRRGRPAWWNAGNQLLGASLHAAAVAACCLVLLRVAAALENHPRQAAWPPGSAPHLPRTALGAGAGCPGILLWHSVHS